ncbi:Uncharacterised protein [Mycobacteroides abscessus]|nr:Uncharacterised protein [Mycobacteroides abscessus]
MLGVHGDVLLGVLAREDPDLGGLLRQVRQHLEEHLRADAASLHVGCHGEPSERRLGLLDLDADGADEARAEPGADRHDVLAREVLAQLVEGLGQRGDVRVLVQLRLGDERRPAQGQELTCLGVGDEAGRDLRVAHGLMVSDIRARYRGVPGDVGRPRPRAGRRPHPSGCATTL